MKRLLLAATASAHFVDGARMQALATQYAELALAQTLRDGCSGAVTGSAAEPRLVVQALPVGSGALHGVAVSTSWSYSPLAGGRRQWHRDSSSTAVWCE